jgi:hypothetical protein
MQTSAFSIAKAKRTRTSVAIYRVEGILRRIINREIVRSGQNGIKAIRRKSQGGMGREGSSCPCSHQKRFHPFMADHPAGINQACLNVFHLQPGLSFQNRFGSIPGCPASIPRTCSTARRRPRITGFPPKIIGLAVILSNNLFSSMDISSERDEATGFLVFATPAQSSPCVQLWPRPAAGWKG